MTYTEIYNSVMGDCATRARIAVAAAKYARYLLGQTPLPSADRVFWAKTTLQDARLAADAIFWGVVGDPAYLAAGPEITDAALQAAVETSVQQVIPG